MLTKKKKKRRRVNKWRGSFVIGFDFYFQSKSDIIVSVFFPIWHWWQWTWRRPSCRWNRQRNSLCLCQTLLCDRLFATFSPLFRQKVICATRAYHGRSKVGRGSKTSVAVPLSLSVWKGLKSYCIYQAAIVCLSRMSELHLFKLFNDLDPVPEWNWVGQFSLRLIWVAQNLFIHDVLTKQQQNRSEQCV